MDRTKLFRLLGIPFVLVAAGVPLLLAALALLLAPGDAGHAAQFAAPSVAQWLLAGALLAGLAALLAAGVLARRVRREIGRISTAVGAMVVDPSPGDPARHVPPLAIRELDQLGARINALADDREARLSEALARLNEREAVLTSMVEGVLAVDTRHRILNVNPAAARIFGISSAAALDRDLLEVVRNTDLRNFIGEALNSRETVEGDVVIFDPGERFLRAHGSPLRDAQGKIIGAVIVLDDVSALRRLENVRRDFVANVSHELKTPVTSIKGFVETLQGGALQHPEDAERFLAIIARQADRLNAIIEDLLNLSRIERDAEAGDIALEEGCLKPVLQAAIQVCEVQAQAKAVRVELDCEPGLSAPIAAPLLEQALVNLIDNAVKYSPAAGRVRVEARQTPEETVLRVQDWGVGIEEKHQPRLFERFYRVDKARSRKLGGTGLGLAIVKHIAQAHGGQVTVESAVGRGSTFSLHLPKRAPLSKVAHA
jgi:two-component system phosphate regulon sensor histidine kinase PhoR